MKIELLNGSIWQCVGSDNYNSLVGANPVGGLIGYADLAFIQADADIINTGKISSMGSNTSMGAGGLIGYGIDTSIISRNGMLQNKGEVTAAITSVGGIGGHMTSSDKLFAVYRFRPYREV